MTLFVFYTLIIIRAQDLFSPQIHLTTFLFFLVKSIDRRVVLLYNIE